MLARQTIWQTKAPESSHIAKGRYGLSHPQLAVVNTIVSGLRETKKRPPARLIIERLKKFERFGPKNAGNKTLRRIAEDIVSGAFDNEQLMDEALNSPSWVINAPAEAHALNRVLKQDSLTEMGNKARIWGHALGRFMSHIFLGQMSKARASNNQGLIDAANILYRDPVSKRQTQSYDQVKTMHIGRYMNQYTKLLDPLNDQQKKALRAAIKEGRLLNNKNTDDPALIKAMTEYRQFMNRLRNHMQAAGLDIGDRGKDRAYFPWVFEPSAFGDRGNEFKKLAMQPKYKKHWEALIKQKYEEAGKTPPDFADPMVIDNFVTAYIRTLSMQDGFADSEVVVDPTKTTQPHVRAMLRRELDFLQSEGNAEDRKVLASFLSDDMNRVISVYVNQAVKRATFMEFFGKGRMQDIEANIVAQGGGEEEIRMFRNMVDMQMGTYGLQFGPVTQSVLTKAGEMIGKDWSDLDPKQWRALQGWIVTYQNVRVLAFSALTNLVDAAGLVVRSGDLSASIQGMREGYKAMVSGEDGNYLAEQAEMLGATEQVVVQDVLGDGAEPVLAHVCARHRQDLSEETSPESKSW